MAVFNGELYAGGLFTYLGDGTTTVNNIARWDGINWYAVGNSPNFGVTGSNARVFALGVFSNYLFVGGIFSSAGGISSTNIARWDGTSNWLASTGFVDYVVAFAAYDGKIYYAGGNYLGYSTTNGASWTTNLPSATCPTTSVPINALTVYNSSLYIGGNFNTFGSATSAKIAAYNTTRGCFSVGTTGLSGTSPSVYTFSVK